jgi:hypothetical protein
MGPNVGRVLFAPRSGEEAGPCIGQPERCVNSMSSYEGLKLESAKKAAYCVDAGWFVWITCPQHASIYIRGIGRSWEKIRGQ